MNREDAEKKIIELAQWRCTTKLCEGRINCYKCKEDRLEEAMKVIEALQKRPKGRWIRYKYSHKLGECSLCGEIVAIRSNYCPNCGADMREIENE